MSPGFEYGVSNQKITNMSEMFGKTICKTLCKIIEDLKSSQPNMI